MLEAKYHFEAIGTQWLIETPTPLSHSDRDTIQQIITEFDHVYSRFREDSLVRQIERTSHPKVYAFPDTIETLWQWYAKLYAVTEGGVSPLVGKSLESLGYDSDYSLRFMRYTPAPPLATVEVRQQSLYVREPVLIDIGAIGKGLLVDRIADYIAKQHDQYVVDGSGDMRVCSDKEERVGLEHPAYVDQVIGVLKLKDGAICASATNRRAWGEGMHHVVDARTGVPLKNGIDATWAVASSAVMADACATALFFISGIELINTFGNFYYVVLHSNGTVEHNISHEVGEIF